MNGQTAKGRFAKNIEKEVQKAKEHKETSFTTNTIWTNQITLVLDISAAVYRPCRRNETASPQKWYRRFSEK